jgi:hypothetical protein
MLFSLMGSSKIPWRVLAAGLLAAVAAPAAGLRAGAAKMDITPAGPAYLMGYRERQSTGVNDRLYHRVAVLEDGATTFALVATDVCLYSPALYDETAEELQRALGIPRVHFWWTVTHTHSAPELGPIGNLKLMMPERFTRPPDLAYAERVKRALIDGVREARAKLTPVRLAVGVGFSNANINRRARDPKGRISLGLNPDGPVDRQIGLMRLSRPDGSPVVLIANYSMHGTVLGQDNLLISADAPGLVAEYVEQKLGAPMLYINGAAGDIAPIYSVTPSVRASHISEFNVLLGDKILAACGALPAGSDQVKIRAGETAVETPLRPGFRWDESMARYLRTTAPGEARVRIPVRSLELGDAVVWTAPLELFSEISMKVRRESRFRNTFYFGYANGWMGYLATKAAFAEGGYEVGAATSPFTDQAERDFSEGVIRYLHGMANGRKTP